MVIFPVHPESQRNRRQRIERAQQMKSNRRNRPFYDHQAEILYVAENRIQQKQPLCSRRISVDAVKDGRQISQQGQKHIIKILRIPEEDKHSRQDHANSQIKGQQARDGV